MVCENNEVKDNLSIKSPTLETTLTAASTNEYTSIPVLHSSGNISDPTFYNTQSSSLPYDRSLLDCFYYDTRYFVIKSNNYENVMLAKHRCVWLTPAANETKLNTAYERHRNVILLFSVKESGRFSGIARLMSPSVVRDEIIPWVLPPSIDPRKLRNTFNIMWINKSDLFFSTCSHLTNPWNENKEVKIARDGQEIEPTLGKTLCKMFPPDPVTESCVINFVKMYSPDLFFPKQQQQHTTDPPINNKSSENNSPSDKLPPIKHENHLNENPYPTDIYTSMDFGRQLLDSILNKSYEEYIESVKCLRKQMNLQALGIENLDQFDFVDNLDPTLLAEELIKYYSNNSRI